MTGAAFRYPAQAAIYAAFAIVVWYFSQAPAYRPIPADSAQIKLSLAHGGQPKGGCRERTADELAALAANMRKTVVCPRERVPLHIVFELDGTRIYEDDLPPTGLRRDGSSKTYRKFVVAAGAHDLTLKLRDSERADGFDYVSQRTVNLVAGQNLAIDFDTVAGGFVFR